MAFALLIASLVPARAQPAPAPAGSPVLDRGDAVVSGFSGIKPAPFPLPPGTNPLDGFFIDLDGASARILSLRAVGGPPQGQLVNLPAKLAIPARDVGQVFAITLDDGQGGTPNIYLAATSAYGIQIVLPDGFGPGQAKRLRNGQAGARFMPGQLGSAPGATPGAIWKVDGRTGAVSLFATIPGNTGPGIGDIVYDARTRHFYASDLDTGLIHRIRADGTPAGSFDHGLMGRPVRGLAALADDGSAMSVSDPGFDTTNPATWGFTPAGRRIGGMAVHHDRLYYAVAEGNQIWSVAINADGTLSNPRWELDVAGMAADSSVTDMLFDAQGRMMLAQRGAQRGSYDYSVFAEPAKSAVLRYRLEQPDDPATPSRWVALADEYAIGMPTDHRAANGGIALGYGHDATGNLRAGACSTMLWSTGDRLRSGALPEDPAAAPTDDVHGLQGHDISLVRPQNVPPQQAYFADYDGLFGDAAKAGHIGDVEIWQPCAGPEFTQDFGPGFAWPGYWPPLVEPPPFFPPEFPPPTHGYRSNLELTKRVVGKCFETGSHWVCPFIIRVRNTGPDNYFAPILIADWMPGAPAGAAMLFGGAPWSCWATGPVAYRCWRGPTFLVPGASVTQIVLVGVPKNTKVCSMHNAARIEWAPGGSPWNSNPGDDMDAASGAIPASHCLPQGNRTNLKLEKRRIGDRCNDLGNGASTCPFLITVENTGPGTFNGPIVVRDTVPGKTTATFEFGIHWTCAGVAPSTYECTHKGAPVTLAVGQKVFLWAHVRVPDQVMRGMGCEVPNRARIVAAPGGTPLNENPGDDEALAGMLGPVHLCTRPVEPAQCPPGYRLRDNACVSTQTPPPTTIPPIIPPPQVCPAGTVGRFPDCLRPDPQCPPGSVGRYPNCRTVDPECPPGTVGRYPNCRQVEVKCPEGMIGTPPNCRRPTPQCPPGTTGTPPNCRPIQVKCPEGMVGTPPNCRKPEVQRCPPGTVGRFPNCRAVNVPKCPAGMIGKPPSCRPLSRPCPPGTFGVYPRCQPKQGTVPGRLPGSGLNQGPRPNQLPRLNLNPGGGLR
jgi:hypothetical protein